MVVHDGINSDRKKTFFVLICSLLRFADLQFLFAELNTFYVKYVLWVPPPNFLNLVRLMFYLLGGAVGMREAFEYFDNP